MTHLSRGVSMLDDDETMEKYEKRLKIDPGLRFEDDKSDNSHIEKNGLSHSLPVIPVTHHLPSAPSEDQVCAENAVNESIRHRKSQRRKSSDENIENLGKDCEPNSTEDDHREDIVHPEDDDDYQRPAKLDLIVGILRFLNYLSASAAVFGIVLSLYLPLREREDDILTVLSSLSEEQREAIGYNKNWKQTPETYRWILYVKTFAGIIQLLYLIVAAVIVTIDNIATMTFRWKEYGELTHRHTDATSFLFLLSKSRWKMRLITSLTIASALSLHTTHIIIRFYGRFLEDQRYKSRGIPPDQIPNLGLHAVIWYISVLLSSLLSFLIGYILHLIPHRFRDVPWLDNYITSDHVDDKGDTWKSRREVAILKIQHISTLVESTVPQYFKERRDELEENYYEHKYKKLSTPGKFIETINKGIYFICFIISIAFNVQALVLMDLDYFSFEFWTIVISSAASISIALYLVILVVMQGCQSPGKVTPALSRLFIPFLLSSGIRQLLDLSQNFDDVLSFVLIYITLIAIFFLASILYLAAKSCVYEKTLDFFFLHFLFYNFCSAEGAYKKVVRLFDTLGSFFALTGLIIGVFSVFTDQYDMEFEPLGELKSLVDAFKKFSNGIRSVEVFMKNVIKEFDFEVTCEHIYTSIASGTLAGIFLSLVPGASSAAAIGTKTASYTVRVGSALSKLAKMLKDSAKRLWSVQKVIRRVVQFTFGNFKKFTVGGSSFTLLKLLPFLPPVVVGVYVLFSAFWPQRILFFSASQRRRFINGQFLMWLLSIVLLVLALSINTAIVDELVRVFDENLPLVKVNLLKKLGWKLSIAASTFAITSSVFFFLSFLILKIKTDKNHDNLTNEEIDWMNELEKRKLVAFRTPFGPKIEKRNQIRYKKERIGPWTWVLPILLCTFACGFGVLANLYPKIDMLLEPKGTFGRTLDKIYGRISSYEDDVVRVRQFGERECLPWQTLNNVFSETLEQRSNILMNPINAFFNKTEELFRPVKQILNRTRKQIIADIGDDLFGQDVLEAVENIDLQYMGMLLLIPRLINLAILIFGMFTMSVATCRMIIWEAVEPKKIVEAFGTVTTFSVVFVLGAQLALFNILEDFGVPFYRITVRFGLGFIYDLVCDCIMISIYIGMKNEFFFAIPKKKVTITYSVPGVSDEGPNIRGQII